jgi:hypothetical protein
MKHLTYLGLAFLFSSAAAQAQMSAPIPMTAAQFASSPTGATVTLALRVNRLARTALDGELLDRVNDALYKKTGRRVQLYVPAETPFIMGSFSDLRPGAIIFVYAVTTTAAHADVKKIVVVTAYAKVE